MKRTILGNHSKSYIIQVQNWAKVLETDEVTIWRDGSVTLDCKDGCICDHYRPTPDELNKAVNKLSWKEQAAFYGEY